MVQRRRRRQWDVWHGNSFSRRVPVVTGQSSWKWKVNLVYLLRGLLTFTCFTINTRTACGCRLITEVCWNSSHGLYWCLPLFFINSYTLIAILYPEPWSLLSWAVWDCCSSFPRKKVPSPQLCAAQINAMFIVFWMVRLILPWIERQLSWLAFQCIKFQLSPSSVHHRKHITYNIFGTHRPIMHTRNLPVLRCSI